MLLGRFRQFCQAKRRNTLCGSLVVSPPSTRTDAHDLMEGASERRLIREACLFRNVGQRLARVDQEILGTFNPADRCAPSGESVSPVLHQLTRGAQRQNANDL